MSITEVIVKFDLDGLEVSNEGDVNLHMGRELSREEWLQLIADVADLEANDE